MHAGSDTFAEKSVISSSSPVTTIFEEPMILLTSPIDSATSRSFDSFTGGAPAAFRGHVALPETVLTQPVSSTTEAVAPARTHARILLPVGITQTLWPNHGRCGGSHVFDELVP